MSTDSEGLPDRHGCYDGIKEKWCNLAEKVELRIIMASKGYAQKILTGYSLINDGHEETKGLSIPKRCAE